MRYFSLLGLLLAACGGAGFQPVEGKPGHYRLHYCAEEADCAKAAKRACPNGHRVIKYSAHPEVIVCE